MIYADLEYLLEKIDSCQNDPEKSSTEKMSDHTPSGYSLITCCSFDASKNKWSCSYRGKDCMEMFCKNLRDQAMETIDFEKKEMISLTDKEADSYEKQKVCYICEKEISTDKNDEKYYKVRDHCYYTGKFTGAAHSNCNLRNKISKEILIVFHNGSTYDYYLIIKQLAIEFKGEF